MDSQRSSFCHDISRTLAMVILTSPLDILRSLSDPCLSLRMLYFSVFCNSLTVYVKTGCLWGNNHDNYGNCFYSWKCPCFFLYWLFSMDICFNLVRSYVDFGVSITFCCWFFLLGFAFCFMLHPRKYLSLTVLNWDFHSEFASIMVQTGRAFISGVTRSSS